jgi:cobalt/nickel transport system ATP-binding protein
MKKPIIQLENISFAFPGRRPVLNKLNLSLANCDRAGLIAPNGSGKTTLFHLIMGLIKPTAGTIRIFGKKVEREKDFREVRQRIGLLFQDSDDQLFSPTVIEDVAFGPLNLGKNKKEAVAIAEETLRALGLENMRDRVTFKLSGGEKRLVALATVLAMKPDALLLDEPVTGLDHNTQIRIEHILQQLDISYIMISHNMDFLARLTTQIFSLKDGKITVDDMAALHPHFHLHAHGIHPHEHPDMENNDWKQ